MTGLEVRRAGRVVLVQDSKASAPAYPPQEWSVDEWAALVRVIKQDAVHTDILSKDPVLPLVIFGLHRHDPLYVDLDDWAPFVAGVKAGEYDIDKLSSGDAASPVSADGAVRVVAGAGQAGNPPSAPAATEVPPVDVPAGRPTPVPAQVALPQEAGRPGPEPSDADVMELAEVLTGAWMNQRIRFGGYSLARWILAAGYRRDRSLLDADEALRRGAAPLVNHVDSESSRIGVAAGGAPAEAGVSEGGEAGPGSPPVGPGPAEPVSRTVFDEGGCDCGCEDAS